MSEAAKIDENVKRLATKQEVLRELYIKLISTFFQIIKSTGR